jgi:Zn-dependent peptidase ImmA (M78 family)
MAKKLSVQKIAAVLGSLNIGASMAAQRLGVPVPVFEAWLAGNEFPPPDKLLRLGTLLRIPHSEMVVSDSAGAPVVAFRKARGTKTTERHYEEARGKGRLLRHLVPFLKFNSDVACSAVSNPVLQYGFLSNLAASIRSDIGINEEDRISFDQLIQFFNSLRAILIPVMWGRKKTHENAVHIYLPEPRVTWIYLNLDVNLLDFKFWMAHELGHCLTPTLRGEEAEDFADAFAGALLFPSVLAERAYASISKIGSSGSQLQAIKTLSGKYGIAAYTIYSQINAYADHVGSAKLSLEPTIHQVSEKVNSGIKPVSELLLGGVSTPTADHVIDVFEKSFNTQFYSAFRNYIRSAQLGPGIVEAILGVSKLDAKSIHLELANASV